MPFLLILSCLAPALNHYFRHLRICAGYSEQPNNEEIMNNLWDLMIDDEYTFVHKWQVGDVAVMDNRVLLHYREPFPETEIRTMWRTQTVGKKLISAFENRVSSSASRL